MKGTTPRRSKEGTVEWWEPRSRASCGTGFVAEISGEPSRRVVTLAIRALRRLSHRGGRGADEATGDGAGLLVDLPQELFRRIVAEEIDRSLSPGEELAVGMVSTAPESIGRLERTWIVQSERLGLRPLGSILYLLRKRLERSFADDPQTHFCSVSARTIVYKGLLTADQLAPFYPDLRQSGFIARVALFHERFATNTLPDWSLAQPFRLLAHNGEINTIRGNRLWMEARDGGTGASPLGSMKNAGFPWEPAIAEVHRALVGAGLRRWVRLRVAGELREGMARVGVRRVDSGGCSGGAVDRPAVPLPEPRRVSDRWPGAPPPRTGQRLRRQGNQWRSRHRASAAPGAGDRVPAHGPGQRRPLRRHRRDVVGRRTGWRAFRGSQQWCDGDESLVQRLLRRHLFHCGSTLASRILDGWNDERAHFVKLLPVALELLDFKEIYDQQVAARLGVLLNG